MEIKKNISILLFFFLLSLKLFSNSFIVEPFVISEDCIQINYETVIFKEHEIKVIYDLENTSNNKVSSIISIICYPTNGVRWLLSPVLIPDNFKIFLNDLEIDYQILFSDKEYTKDSVLKDRGEGNSEIHFQLTWDSKESKQIIFTYENDAKFLKHEFDTTFKLTERHFFNSRSIEKKAIYIPNDSNLRFDTGFSLQNFIIFSNNEYINTMDYSRIYEKDNFKWIYIIPNDVNEIVCIQDYFGFSWDWARLHLYYKECYPSIKEKNILFFSSKNLERDFLTKLDLFTLSKKQLSILRNSFYAKYGYDFKNKELREYFEANCKSQGITYKVNPNFSESVFNEVERKNIEHIKEMENMKEPILLSDLQ